MRRGKHTGRVLETLDLLIAVGVRGERLARGELHHQPARVLRAHCDHFARRIKRRRVRRVLHTSNTSRIVYWSEPKQARRGEGRTHVDLFGPDGRVRQRVPEDERLVVAHCQELVALRVRRQTPELVRVAGHEHPQLLRRALRLPAQDKVLHGANEQLAFARRRQCPNATELLSYLQTHDTSQRHLNKNMQFVQVQVHVN